MDVMYTFLAPPMPTLDRLEATISGSRHVEVHERRPPTGAARDAALGAVQRTMHRRRPHSAQAFAALYLFALTPPPQPTATTPPIRHVFPRMATCARQRRRGRGSALEAPM